MISLCFACVKCFTLFQIEDWWICGPWYVPVIMVNPTSTLSVRRISLENETFRLEYLYISKDSFFFKFHFQVYNEKFKLKSFIFKWNSTYSKRWRRVHHEFWYVSRATNPPTLDLREWSISHTRNKVARRTLRKLISYFTAIDPNKMNLVIFRLYHVRHCLELEKIIRILERSRQSYTIGISVPS